MECSGLARNLDRVRRTSTPYSSFSVPISMVRVPFLLSHDLRENLFLSFHFSRKIPLGHPAKVYK
jgi:hypothetical protein